MRKETIGKHTTIKFRDYLEFCEFSKSGEYQASGGYDEKMELSRHEEVGTTGTKTFDEAYFLAVNGWPEATKKSLEMVSSLVEKIAPEIERTSISYDTEGDGIDVARYLDGEPDCWVKFEDEKKSRPSHIVNVVVNGIADWKIKPDDIIASGAVVASLISLLEYSGNRCNVSVSVPIEAKKSAGRTTEIIVPIKKSGENLNFDSMVFALAHPSFLRRLCFSVLERALTDKERVTFGIGEYYGICIDNGEHHKGSIYIPRIKRGDTWGNAEFERRWIVSNLEKQGIKLHKQGVLV